MRRRRLRPALAIQFMAEIEMNKRLVMIRRERLIPACDCDIGLAFLQRKKSAIHQQIWIVRRVLERSVGQSERFVETVLIDQEAQ